MSEYFVPKRRVTTQARLLGLPPRTWELFLSETAANHAGPERPSDLLNHGQPFLAVRDAEAGFMIVSTAHVLAISVPVDAEFHTAGLGAEDLAAASSTHAEVELLLETGDTISGTLVYIQPTGQQRVQDFMNIAPAFIAVREGATAHIVNTRRVARVSLQQEAEQTAPRDEESAPPLDEVFDSEES